VSFERKLQRQARRHALISAKARGCRCRPSVEGVGANAVVLTHQQGCPLLDTIPPHPHGGRVAATLIFPKEGEP
jgi:hypothetical protein